jgi:hypothetical protein
MKDENLIKKMRKGLVVLVASITVILITVVGCTKNEIEKEAVASKGLGLWWNHQMFSEQGRGFIFGFTEIERSETLYELKFEYQIDNNQKSIEISLIEKIDKGKCPQFPMPTPGGNDGLCSSNGNIFIPENMVTEGKYKFTIKTLDYTVHSEFVFTKDKATLNIPDNNYFSSSVKEVIITPKNLLFGGIVFSGEENKRFAFDILEDIRNLGLRDTIWSNPSVFLTNVDEMGNPVINSWPPNYYSVPILFSLTCEFSTVFELVKEHYNRNSVFRNIGLSSSNGDQARFDIFEGINVWYAK